MLVAWLVLPVLLVLVCAGCGLAVARATGVALPRPLVLPVGFALVIVVASAATASNATAEAATPAVLGLAVLGFLVARDRSAWIPEPWSAAAAVGVYLVFGAPVLASGHAVWTGYIQLDDIATWLALTDLAMERGRDFAGLPPSSFEATVRSYLPQGYPIGAFLPLGVGGELTLGKDIARLFAPTMAFTAGLLALTLNVLVAPVLGRPRVRAAVAFVAAQPALLWAYVEWGAMKEVVAALLVALDRRAGPDAPRRPAPRAPPRAGDLRARRRAQPRRRRVGRARRGRGARGEPTAPARARALRARARRPLRRHRDPLADPRAGLPHPAAQGGQRPHGGDGAREPPGAAVGAAPLRASGPRATSA